MKIPISSLSADSLRSIIESFVLREGTDYGHEDHELEAKCAAVLRQLEAGEAEIDFDPATDTVDIRVQDDRVERRGGPDGHADGSRHRDPGDQN